MHCGVDDVHHELLMIFSGEVMLSFRQDLQRCSLLQEVFSRAGRIRTKGKVHSSFTTVVGVLLPVGVSSLVDSGRFSHWK